MSKEPNNIPNTRGQTQICRAAFCFVLFLAILLVLSFSINKFASHLPFSACFCPAEKGPAFEAQNPGIRAVLIFAGGKWAWGRPNEDGEGVIPLICTWLSLGGWWLPELILAGLPFRCL